MEDPVELFKISHRGEPNYQIQVNLFNNGSRRLHQGQRVEVQIVSKGNPLPARFAWHRTDGYNTFPLEDQTTGSYQFSVSDVGCWVCLDVFPQGAENQSSLIEFRKIVVQPAVEAELERAVAANGWSSKALLELRTEDAGEINLVTQVKIDASRLTLELASNEDLKKLKLTSRILSWSIRRSVIVLTADGNTPLNTLRFSISDANNGQRASGRLVFGAALARDTFYLAHKVFIALADPTFKAFALASASRVATLITLGNHITTSKRFYASCIDTTRTKEVFRKQIDELEQQLDVTVVSYRNALEAQSPEHLVTAPLASPRPPTPPVNVVSPEALALVDEIKKKVTSYKNLTKALVYELVIARKEATEQVKQAAWTAEQQTLERLMVTIAQARLNLGEAPSLENGLGTAIDAEILQALAGAVKDKEDISMTFAPYLEALADLASFTAKTSVASVVSKHEEIRKEMVDEALSPKVDEEKIALRERVAKLEAEVVHLKATQKVQVQQETLATRRTVSPARNGEDERPFEATKGRPSILSAGSPFRAPTSDPNNPSYRQTISNSAPRVHNYLLKSRKSGGAE
eukprot:TRINITY_DN11699_c0_g1_i1.p1 TRINITY_DN11699_c0_g1~~TRINITY_DN11699_c0_g1_i1.p1  ORF type:complete len:578 (+),score=112.99 TRINITY_DN11699_c0_g1_i1:114-1847(+)